MTITTLSLFADTSSTGKPVYEEVVVEPLSNHLYRLVQSPGLVLGVAADDIIEVTPDRRHKVVTRGGNLCIQLFSRERIDEIERFSNPLFAAIGGRLDGKVTKELVYTVSVSVGFATVQGIMEKITGEFPFAKWYYGNVYDPRDGITPLDWWK